MRKKAASDGLKWFTRGRIFTAVGKMIMLHENVGFFPSRYHVNACALPSRTKKKAE
jgi:hypothetical protein